MWVDREVCGRRERCVGWEKRVVCVIRGKYVGG